MSTLRSLIQCDFDGTVTEEDAAYFLLDQFAQGDWRRVLGDYEQHRISVREFSVRAFAMIKTDKFTLLRALKDKVKVRPGFHELVDYCREKGLRFVIVSNGLAFYERAMLRYLGLASIEVYGAHASFRLKGMKVKYVGPDGKEPNDGFKETYTRWFLGQRYRVIYIGNGDSDIVPARHAHYVFATDELLAFFRENNLECQPFRTFFDVIRGLELI